VYSDEEWFFLASSYYFHVVPFGVLPCFFGVSMSFQKYMYYW
jgi:hypothetical protein